MVSRDPRPYLTEEPSRVRYWVIVFAVALAVITYIDRVCISFSMPAIRSELGLNAVQAGLAFSAFGWAYALFEIPGGYLGDLMGPRRVLMRIVVWWSFFTAATGWIFNFPSLIATRFLFGAGEAGCFPNLTKSFTTWLPANERVRAQGTMWLSARWGGAFTPPLVALVTTWVGWRHAFEIFGSIGLIWAVWFFMWYRDNPLENPKLNQGERELLRESSKLAGSHGDVPWARFMASPQVWLLCWQYFCLSYGWYFYVTWLPTYLKEARHMDVTQMAFFGILPLFMGGLGNPSAVVILSRLTRATGDVAKSRRMLACFGFAGASGFLVLSTFMGDPLYAMLAIGMASYCNDLVMPGAWASAMDVGGPHAGTLSGAMNMLGNIGGAICPMVIGFILKFSDNNWNLTFYLSAVIYALGILCWIFLDPVTPLEEDHELPVAA